MPLDTATLKTDLEALFATPSIVATTLATQWSDAFEAWAGTVTPVTSAATAAAATLNTALIPIFATVGVPATKLAAMDTAFAAFANAIGLGMAPAFTPVSPPLTPGFVAEAAPPFPTTHLAASIKWGDFYDTWFKTGEATPSGGGSPVPWT